MTVAARTGRSLSWIVPLAALLLGGAAAEATPVTYEIVFLGSAGYNGALNAYSDNPSDLSGFITFDSDQLARTNVFISPIDWRVSSASGASWGPEDSNAQLFGLVVSNFADGTFLTLQSAPGVPLVDSVASGATGFQLEIDAGPFTQFYVQPPGSAFQFPGPGTPAFYEAGTYRLKLVPEPSVAFLLCVGLSVMASTPSRRSLV